MNTEKLDQALTKSGLQYAKPPHPDADPQALANIDHLNRVLRKEGPAAAVAEFRKMFSAGGTLPAVEQRHRNSAAAYRRWNHLPPLTQTDDAAKPEPVTTGK